ncbi:MAG: hypothetical protein WBQ34_10070 [Candidatus Acidiferrales bacterium]
MDQGDARWHCGAASGQLMIDVSRKTALFFDASAGYTHIAEAVVPEFARVLYFNNWETAFPQARDITPGIGLEGVERVSDFFDALEDADVAIFTDVGNGGLQEFLRARGMPVFGSGRSEALERDRWFLKQTARESGIDYSDGFLIHGIENLRKLLQRQNDLYVKISYLRGDMESFHHENYLSSKPWIDQLSLNLGPYGAVADFIVEPPIESDLCVEVGADPAWCCDGKFPSEILWGYEEKDRAYAGTIHALPAKLQSVLDKLSPVLAKDGYRGPLSTETRECEDASYLIDLTCRFPEPPSSVHSLLARNWGEMMYGAATGQPVEPDYLAHYAVQFVLRSPFGAEHPLAVKIGMPERVTIHGHAIIENQDYAVSPAEIEEFGAGCGFSDSLSDAAEEALEAAKSVEGYQVSFDEAALEKLMETIQNGRKLDLQWGQINGENHGEESRTAS